MSKNLLPNLIAAALVALSFVLPEPWRAVVLSVGLFALSGALTNWLAIHMLFERIPGIYGSGIIPLHFEEFKAGILRMVHEELFNKDKVEALLTRRREGTLSVDAGTSDDANHSSDPLVDIDIEPILQGIDLDIAFDQLVSTVTSSTLGSMLGMFGGQEVLEQLREPFKARMGNFLGDVAASPRFREALSKQLASAASSERFLEKLDQLLRDRLDEMTPEMVRDLIQRMIRKHLGWLVVWGAVFGGLIGLAAALVQM